MIGVEGRDQTFVRERPAPVGNAEGDAQVEIERYGFNGFVLTVNAPRPGLVYASENYFDGWTATVNGAAVSILPANYAFRAVAVPPGRSRISFSYWPPGLTAGIVVSSIAALLTLVLAMIRGRSATVRSLPA